MNNSPLVKVTKLSPHCSRPRNAKIDTITIHCVVGQVTAESLGDWLANPSALASANYGVDKDGRVGLYVNECDRSWCSSSAPNDNRAVTIEVASDAAHPYAVTEKAMAGLIELVTDICQRNGIARLLWRGDRSLIGQVDRQNMTVHRWFANKACPGDYLYERHASIAEEVNRRLGASVTPPTPEPPPVGQLYRVRRERADSASQIGAYSSLDNAKTAADANRSGGYKVFDAEGAVAYDPNNPGLDPKTPLKTPEEVTVDNAIADGIITDRAYWLGVLTGKVQANGGNVKTLLDNTHRRIMETS